MASFTATGQLGGDPPEITSGIPYNINSNGHSNTNGVGFSPSVSSLPSNNGTINGVNGNEKSSGKKRIFLNGFDMFTPGHLSFGQWRNPTDRAKDKRRDLSYWTDVAKILDKGGFTAFFLADSFGPYDTYKGSAEPAIRTGSQWPMADPAVVRASMLICSFQ